MFRWKLVGGVLEEITASSAGLHEEKKESAYFPSIEIAEAFEGDQSGGKPLS